MPLSQNDELQEWGWNSILFSACRSCGLNPTNEHHLKKFFRWASEDGDDHYVRYEESLRAAATHPVGARKLPAPKPVIPPDVRAFAESVLHRRRSAQAIGQIVAVVHPVILTNPTPMTT